MDAFSNIWEEFTVIIIVNCKSYLIVLPFGWRLTIYRETIVSDLKLYFYTLIL